MPHVDAVSNQPQWVVQDEVFCARAATQAHSFPAFMAYSGGDLSTFIVALAGPAAEVLSLSTSCVSMLLASYPPVTQQSLWHPIQRRPGLLTERSLLERELSR